MIELDETRPKWRQVADILRGRIADGTYPPEAVHKLLAPLLAGEADMTVGSRLHADSRSEFKHLNR